MGSETLPMMGKLLGHASVKSTARYWHLDNGHLQEAAEQVGRARSYFVGIAGCIEIGAFDFSVIDWNWDFPAVRCVCGECPVLWEPDIPYSIIRATAHAKIWLSVDRR